MRIGIHVSISGGLSRAITRAEARGCETIQIFARTPRAWKAKPWDPAEVEAFRSGRTASGISPVVIHTCYLINLATDKEDLREKSISALADDLARAEMGGIEYVVTHPGSSHGVDGGTERVRQCCLEAMDRVDGKAQILIENVAGGGDKVGGDFAELAEMVDGTGMGICLDTCHAFAAGMPLHKDPSGVLDELDEAMGLERLRALHLNDSFGEFGKRIDHHQHIGEGFIGMEGFRTILGEPRIRAVAGILETPQRATDDPTEDLRNIGKIREILAGIEGS